MAFKQMFFIAQTDVEIEQLSSIGPGDEDVNTKSGRSTTVKVKTSNPMPANGATRIDIGLEYSVAEGHKDFTHLLGQRTVSIELERGLRINTLGAGYKDADYSEVIQGQHHEWIDISDRPNIRGSILQHCSIKIDGKGDDDRGNARLMAHIAVPLLVDVEMENPPTDAQTQGGDSGGHTVILGSQAIHLSSELAKGLASPAKAAKLIRVTTHAQ